MRRGGGAECAHVSRASFCSSRASRHRRIAAHRIAPAKSAHALSAHFYYNLWEDIQAQLVTTATLGGGSAFRLKVNPDAVLTASDTVSGGPVVLGPGMAFFYNLSSHVLIAAEVKLLIGMAKWAALLDGTLGVQYTF